MRHCKCKYILDYSDYLGRLAIGRIYNGAIEDGQQVVLLKKMVNK